MDVHLYHVIPFVKEAPKTSAPPMVVFFGSGIYITPNIQYAAKYSMGHYTLHSSTHLNEYTILLCVVVVGLTYPISRKTDYTYPDCYDTYSVSRFHFAHPIPEEAVVKAKEGDFSLVTVAMKKRHDKALEAGFDSHFVCVSPRKKYQAVQVGSEENLFELVVKEEAQVLPLAVVYVKKT